MENSKTWLEVTLSGSSTRELQANIPLTVNEIIEEGLKCAGEGAGIINVTAFDEKTGGVSNDPDDYSKIIEGIRTKVDAIVYPHALAFKANPSSPKENSSPSIELTEKLCQRGHLEWISVNPGSTNIAHYDELRADTVGVTRINLEADVRTALKLAKAEKLHPTFEIFGPGSIRMGASLNWREDSPVAVYRLVFSSGFALGFPPEDYGLTAYLNLLDQVAPGAPWMISGMDAEVASMIPRAVLEGGHVRVGLGDAPFGSELSNLDIVTNSCREIENSGGTVGSGEDIRNALGGIRKNPELMQHI